MPLLEAAITALELGIPVPPEARDALMQEIARLRRELEEKTERLEWLHERMNAPSVAEDQAGAHARYWLRASIDEIRAAREAEEGS